LPAAVSQWGEQRVLPILGCCTILIARRIDIVVYITEVQFHVNPADELPI
jgi:hypothetical protein